MGLAASQARLLSITARMHDVEFKAQNIMNQKVALATQKDELYSAYCDALDAKKIQIAVGSGLNTKFVDATYASVCGYQEGRATTYALADADTGKLIVENEVYNAYRQFNNDKYAFAWAMLGFSADDASWIESEGWATESNTALLGIQVGGKMSEDSDEFTDSATGTTFGVLLMTEAEKKVFEENEDKLAAPYQKYTEALESGDKKKVQDAFNNFRKVLYDTCSSQIYDQMRVSKNDNSSNEFMPEFSENFDCDLYNYYVKLFEGIKSAGGCYTINDFTENGDTGNEWFNNAVNSGKVIIMEYKTTGTQKGWNEISVATSTNLQEVADEADLKKAEAEYEYELGKINDKDKSFDRDLNKLETERTALKTEMDSIKQVKDDNIERTFGIFS